jgi:hypothetical protein
LRSKWAADKAVRAGLAVEGAYLNGYVTDEQRSRGPFSSQPFGPWPVGCFSALLAPYVSIQDTLVATASPARTALKNGQLTCGETYAYFGDRTLTRHHKTVAELLLQTAAHPFKLSATDKIYVAHDTPAACGIAPS